MNIQELLNFTKEIRQNLPTLSKEELIDVVQDLLGIVQEYEIVRVKLLRELREYDDYTEGRETDE